MASIFITTTYFSKKHQKMTFFAKIWAFFAKIIGNLVSFRKIKNGYLTIQIPILK
jgi:hypothetical protein